MERFLAFVLRYFLTFEVRLCQGKMSMSRHPLPHEPLSPPPSNSPGANKIINSLPSPKKKHLITTQKTLSLSSTNIPKSQTSNLLLRQAISPPLHLRRLRHRKHPLRPALFVPRPPSRPVHL